MSRNKLFIARCVIETESPIALHSGNREYGFDTQLARDWNSLPYIPATSIVGVWRSLIPLDEAEKWFGSAKDKGNASLLSISDALMLNSKSEYFPKLAGKSILNDKLYQKYGEDRSEIRERCRISHRGAAVHEGKFDVAVLPTGIRFVFDVRAELTESQNFSEVRQLLAYFKKDSVYLGSGMTNGQGKIKLVGYTEFNENLSEVAPAELQQKITKFVSAKVPLTIDDCMLQCKSRETVQILAEIPMIGRDTWKIGENIVDKTSCCHMEHRIIWDKNGQEKLDLENERIVVPGSSLKGIIAHRTDFHFRKLKMVSDTVGEDLPPQSEISISHELEELFGTAGDGDDIPARAGQLIVEDTVIENVKNIERTHVKIDRFSGGAYDGALFTERRIYKPRMTFRIKLKTSMDNNSLSASREIKNSLAAKALARTITDIIEGFLPIASGSGRQAGLLECDYEAGKHFIFNQELLETGRSKEQ